VEYVDRVLTCTQCRAEFVFSGGEQEFFADKGFKSDPRRCKQCKAKQKGKVFRLRPETRTTCAQCGKETTVPFKPVLGKPMLCRLCFMNSKEQVS